MGINIQFGGRLDLDMSVLTKGLSAAAYGGMNFYNTLFTQQNPGYSVYEPVFNTDANTIDSVIIHGVDKTARKFNTKEGNSEFFRQVTYYGTLNYNLTRSEERRVGKEGVSTYRYRCGTDV